MPEKLKTAVLGLNDRGLALVEAASQIEYFHIQAVADKDTRLAEKAAAEYKCTPYDDYRQLIIQNQLDCMLVAAPVYSCDEYLRSAIKKNCHILKIAPPARNFAEATEFAKIAEQQNLKFAVAGLGRFAESFIELRRLLEQGVIEQPFLVSAVCTVPASESPKWLSDPKLAGGGVLLRDCYELIDQLVYNFDLPEKVYALGINQAADSQKRRYLAEDSVAITMNFSDTVIANLVATRNRAVETPKLSLTIYGRHKILKVSHTRLTVFNSQATTSDNIDYNDDELCRMKKLLENFAISILSPDKNVLFTTPAENLKNMAVIESAYLSVRTAMPENPLAILRMKLSNLSQAIDI